MGSSSGATIAAFTGSRQISEEAIEWFRTERKISRETLAKLPVGSGNAYFPESEIKCEAILFRYQQGAKARRFPQKEFASIPGTKLTFWNLDAVLRGSLEDVWICEGELDACALVEAGLLPDQVLAAPAASGGDYAYALDALEHTGLGKVKRIIWCGDQDDAGHRLRADMAKLFGISKFKFVEWPEGVKDANDFLCSDGAGLLLDRVTHGSLEWPTSDLYRIDDLPEPPPMTVWDIGFDSWRRSCKLAAGTLSVVTGHPGAGKTTVWTQLWYQVIKEHKLVACIASFETRPKPHLQRQLRTLHGRRQANLLSPSELAAADQWIRDHYIFMQHAERRPTLPWLLEKAEDAVHRYGVRILLIDPWNRLEASREPRESETDYIGRCLRELYNFAVDLDCHVQIIAHPAKTGDHYRRSDPPELEHIAGSKHWDNMVDQGFVVHRPQLFDENGGRDFYTELHHKKTRFDELGYATKFALEYQDDVRRFCECKLRQRKPPQRRRNDDDE